MSVQPVLGWIHHRNYLKYQRRTTISYGHMWYGKGIMIVGIVNGGIGLQLSGASTGVVAAYVVLSILVSAIYVAGTVRKMARLGKDKHRLDSPASNSGMELMRP